MSLSDIIRACAVLALMFFSVYIIMQNKDDRTRKRWMNIYGAIVVIYCIGEFVKEFFPEL
jgi:hypothetical protein